MDIAHKEYLEKLSKEELINRVLDFKECLKSNSDRIIALENKLNEKQFLIDTLLRVIKYQNGLNDITKEEN